MGYQALLGGLSPTLPARVPHAVYSIDWYHPTAGEQAPSHIHREKAAAGQAPTSPDGERRRAAEAALALRKMPPLLGNTFDRLANAARSTTDPPAGALVDHPASPGRAQGRARIVEGPEDFSRFLPGEILVARATAPAWTPLFADAAAVVTDGGNLAAHASLVAREYCIPAVVATGNAAHILKTGQLVIVDGSAGVVSTHEA